MNAIETRYKGCRFRSRSEARFAVFLDALNVGWEYEKQGYVLNGDRYLPDFWVPDWRAFVEIKGAEPTDREHSLAARLTEMSGRRVILLSGQLWPGEHPTWIYPLSDEPFKADSFGTCRKCPCLFLGSDPSGWTPIGSTCCGSDKWPLAANTGYAPGLMKAYEAARAARFEHGENG